MPEIAKVFQDHQHPGEWRVEWFDNDGGCEVEISSAQTRANKQYDMRITNMRSLKRSALSAS
jgi:hypothetical protein